MNEMPLRNIHSCFKPLEGVGWEKNNVLDNLLWLIDPFLSSVSETDRSPLYKLYCKTDKVN